LFSNLNIGPNGMLLRETTLAFDEYEAGLDTYAAYAMLDTPFWEDFQLAGGARVELTDQRFSAWDPHDREGSLRGSQINDTDVLPALSVVYRVNRNSNTRFGISKTLARPQLREISPFYSTSAISDLPTQGNPDLKLTKILNADLRFETFPTLREVLAFSFFYKHFTDPIEDIILPGGNAGINNYANAPGADLIGLELEARKNLGLLAPSLHGFTVIGNLTLADSRVDLGDEVGTATNPSRPMSYQSPYVVNLSLDYERQASGTSLRVLYWVQGPRITRVGSTGVPDVYEMPRHVVDVTASQKLGSGFDVKLTIQNLLSSDVVFAQKGAREYRQVSADDGTSSYEFVGTDPVTLRYDPGTIFDLQVSYTY
jgi:TonB-dependent receptor